MAGSIIEGAFALSAYKIAGPYFRIAIVACEPYLGIIIIGLCENLNNLFGKPLNMQETLAGNPIVLTIVTIMFIITKILKSNSGTKIFGMITLGEIEKKLAVIFPVILGIINIYMIIKYGDIPDNKSNESILMILFTIILSILSVVVCYIIKTVASCIEILELSLGFIPGFSLFCEIAKSLLVVFLLLISIINPIAGMIINIIIILISAVLFKNSYGVTLYFRKIYINPFIIKLGLKKEKDLLYSEKVLNKIREYFNFSQIDIIIPVFSLKKNNDFKKYEMWYLVSLNNQVFLLKNAFFKKNVKCIKLQNSLHSEIFIKVQKRFIEFFTVFNKKEFIDTNFNKPIKNMSFAFSHEYIKNYNKIISFLKFYEIKKACGKDNF